MNEELIREFIRNSIENKSVISESLLFHINSGVGIDKNIFRPGSEAFFNLFSEARNLYCQGRYKLNENEKFYILETDIGLWGTYENKMVPLDYPVLDESIIIEKRKRKRKKKSYPGNTYKGKKVDLNKPRRGGKKKFYVYVKNPKTGKVIKVEWGAKGMSVGVSDPKRRKSFAARHRCKTHANDKTKPRYWACRTGRYPHLTGSKKKYTWW